MGFDEKAYDKALEKIFALSPSVQSAGFAPGAYKPGLEGMKRFDSILGHPWKKYRCIHVAGTNGKGSVASMLASCLAQGPMRVGLYTSPHITDFRERMRVITGQGWYMPRKQEVWEFLQEYGKELDGLSFFEITTGMAFWWFARKKLDMAVIETGLGGRLDSTNIISPELCVITSIGLDHCAMLGDTRARIAGEKAGIFKPGVPAVVASEDAETAPVFRSAAAKTGCPLIFAGRMEPGQEGRPGRATADGQDKGPAEARLLSRMDLRGPCQKQNLHTSLTALAVLDAAVSRPPQRFRQVPCSREAGHFLTGERRLREIDRLILMNDSAITAAASRTGFRGRWERLQENPEVICDIGHNPPALKLNFARLEAENRPLLIVYGVMRDKDLTGIAPIMPSKAHYILVAPHTPRALPAADLQARLKALRPGLHTELCTSVAEGIERALEAATAAKSLIYIGGSTFVVTEAIEYYKNHPV